MSKSPRHKDLRQAALDEAYRIIEDSGLEALSLREVARRLGVSHQAPYKHFASRDHILAEVIARTFDEFSDFVEQPLPGTSHDDLHAMGLRYIAYAQSNPLKYRLLFNTPKPPADNHPGMMKNARRAFSLLRDMLASMNLTSALPNLTNGPNHDALFIWSTLHGLASILQSDAIKTLGLGEHGIDRAIENCFARIGMALGDAQESRN